jgi:hypothetical protein
MMSDANESGWSKLSRETFKATWEVTREQEPRDGAQGEENHTTALHLVQFSSFAGAVKLKARSCRSSRQYLR